RGGGPEAGSGSFVAGTAALSGPQCLVDAMDFHSGGIGTVVWADHPGADRVQRPDFRSGHHHHLGVVASHTAQSIGDLPVAMDLDVPRIHPSGGISVPGGGSHPADPAHDVVGVSVGRTILVRDVVPPERVADLVGHQAPAPLLVDASTGE